MDLGGALPQTDVGHRDLTSTSGEHSKWEDHHGIAIVQTCSHSLVPPAKKTEKS